MNRDGNRTEPFIAPALFEPYEGTDHPANDEYSLSINLGRQLAPVMTEHYETFIVGFSASSSAPDVVTDYSPFGRPSTTLFRWSKTVSTGFGCPCPFG
jgi:hypothetical protein